MWVAMALTISTPLSGAGKHHQHHRSSSSLAVSLLLMAKGRCIPRSSHLYLSADKKKKKNKPCFKLFCHVQDVDDDEETCELVSGVDLILGDATDAFHAYLLKPLKNNNGTGLLMLSDVFGFQASATRDFAYRVACNGYNVLVPDLFRGNPWVSDRNRSEFDKWVSLHPAERIAKDISTSTNWMIDEFLAAGISKKLGIIGFCFGGGQLIVTLARDQGANFSTGVCFYGTRMDLSVMNDIRVPILFICGDSDPLCPVEVVQDSEKRIGRGSRVVVFKGQGHAFVHRPGSPEADKDAEEAFMVMRNWLHGGLVIDKEVRFERFADPTAMNYSPTKDHLTPRFHDRMWLWRELGVDAGECGPLVAIQWRWLLWA